MPVRDLILVAGLVLIIIATVFIGDAFDSEFYLFVPARYRRFGLPPSSPWLLLSAMVLVMITFFISRRHAAILIGVLALLTGLGLPIGSLLFQWTPGVAHFAILTELSLLTVFVWSVEHLHQD